MNLTGADEWLDDDDTDQAEKDAYIEDIFGQPDVGAAAELPPVPQAVVSLGDQADTAMRELDRPAWEYLHLPWPDVSGLIGGIAPGTIGMLVGYSGQGKSTFLMNLTNELLLQGHCVYYLGLESAPEFIRTQLACLRLNLDPGDVLSGAAKSHPDWPGWRANLIAELDAQRAQRDGHRLLVGNQATVDLPGLWEAAADAHAADASLLIVDHIDHVGTDASYGESVQILHGLLAATKQYKLRTLIASQLNQSSLHGDRLVQFRPPSRAAVKMGGHKMEVSTYALGVYRPLAENISKEDLRAFADGQLEAARLLRPNTMAVVCMKNRFYGGREGQRALLHVSCGRVRPHTSYDEAQAHIMARREREEGLPF